MTDHAPAPAVALAVADLLAARPTRRGRTDHEPGLGLSEIAIPAPPHPEHRAPGALLLLLAPAGGARLNPSLRLRRTPAGHPTPSARRRRPG
jgi:hypothetical protein